MIVSPAGESTLSGWNCTAVDGKRLWRTAMITPSALRAVTARSAGSFTGSAAQLW